MRACEREPCFLKGRKDLDKYQIEGERSFYSLDLSLGAFFFLTLSGAQIRETGYFAKTTTACLLAKLACVQNWTRLISGEKRYDTKVTEEGFDALRGG